jgi:hypothetical protein
MVSSDTAVCRHLQQDKQRDLFLTHVAVKTHVIVRANDLSFL